VVLLKNSIYENQQLVKELEELERLEVIVRKSLKNSPEGKLRSEMAQGKYPQYYYLCKEKKIEYPGKYIRREDEAFASALAQKEYDEQILDMISKKKNIIQRFLNSMMKIGQLETIYSQLTYAKQRIVKNYFMQDSEYLKNWLEEHQDTGNTYPITNGYITQKGELVRSKSEKIIADKLFYYQIPYIYEASLTLQNNHIIFPDFTILNLRTRKTYFFEHFGMMDNPDYCKKALEKIEAYETNHFYLNESLLISMESSLKGISIKQIDSLIQRFLL